MGGAEVGALMSQSRYNKYALARNKQNQRREKKKQKKPNKRILPQIRGSCIDGRRGSSRKRRDSSRQIDGKLDMFAFSFLLLTRCHGH
jgi:hypothetical protein